MSSVNSSVYSEVLSLFGLVALVLLERQVGLPVIGWVLGLFLANSLSNKSRLLGSLVVASYVAVLYATPLWLTLLLLGGGWWLQVRVVQKWQTLSLWLISALSLLGLFWENIARQNVSTVVVQIIVVLLIQHGWRWWRWWYRVRRSLRIAKRVKVMTNDQ